jgi:fumarate hydratase subunit beta
MLMAVHYLKTPVSEAEIRKLRANDVVYLSGTTVTARDQAHRRALEWNAAGKALPVNLEGLAVFHCGPVMEKRDGRWVAVAAGPTTSTRMDVYEEEFIRAFKPRIIIGKGGMGKRTTDALTRYGCVYCAFTGGAAVLAANAIKSVVGVEWLDLGMPEAMWIFNVEQFGPLVVAIDSHGRNLFMDVKGKVEANRQRIYEKFSL